MGGARLFGDQLGGFLVELAALGVAEDDVADGEFLEHAGGDFAGEGAEIVLAHVLRAQAQVGIHDGLGHFGQRGERRADHDVRPP